MVEPQSAVKPRLHPVTDDNDAQRMPLPERRWQHGRRGQLVLTTVVVILGNIAQDLKFSSAMNTGEHRLDTAEHMIINCARLWT